jgi:hypothetical protein
MFSNSAAERTSMTMRSWCSWNQLCRVSGARAVTAGADEVWAEEEEECVMGVLSRRTKAEYPTEYYRYPWG